MKSTRRFVSGMLYSIATPAEAGIASSSNALIINRKEFSQDITSLRGEFRFSFGATPDGIGAMARPRDIAFDSDGNVYVTDAMLQEFQIYDPEGELLLRVGSEGMDGGQFRLPAGIRIDDDDRIHVVDSLNQRVQRFRYVAESRKEQEQ